MSKTRAVILISFALVFAAGAAVGRLTARSRPRGDRGSWLARELKLNDEQREQMHAIWSEAMEPLGESRGERYRLMEERDAALRALLTEEQTAEHEAIRDGYRLKMDALGQKRRAAFEQAVARTKEILTPEQREKYDEMLSRMPEPGRRRGPGGGMRPRGPRPPAPKPDDTGPPS